MSVKQTMNILVRQYEEATIGEYHLGHYINNLQKDAEGDKELEVNLELIHNYFSSARCCRFERSGGLHEVGFTKREQLEINEAWKFFGGTVDLFDLNAMQNGHDYHEFRIFNPERLKALNETCKGTIHIDYILESLRRDLNKTLIEMGVGHTEFLLK